MRRRRWVKALAALALLALLLVAAAVWFVRRPWPQEAGALAVAGLAAPVDVVRDRWGVPHLYAASEHDLFLAQGFVHAQDRLWQMEMNRRIARGELSAVLGPAALEVDVAMRTLGMRRAAERDWARMAPEPRAVLTAYAAGVNAFLAGHRGRLPLEFTLLGVHPDPWRPVDTLAWGKVMCWNLGENYSFELSRARLLARLGPEAAQQLLPPYRSGAPVVVPPQVGGFAWLRDARFDGLARLVSFFANRGADWGSNNWVVRGSRTATGRPLLANDTHLALTMPSAWYANDLHGGRFASLGYTLPGVPMVLVGHNARIAWGVTDMIPDVEDFYVEKFDDREHPRRYLFRGVWRDLLVLSETIAVKGRAPERLDVLLTHHGPVMNRVSSRLQKVAEPYTLRWAAVEPGDLLEGVLRINLAADWRQFRNGLRRWSAPNLNFVYADVDDHIGYQATGYVPLRAPGHQGLVPVPGWTGEYEWRGFIPFDELPTLYDPPSGFIVTANNKVAGDGYPYPLAYEWADPYRAMRISQVLAATPRATLAGMGRLQADTFSLPAAALLPYLRAVAPASDLERRALALVRAWDLCNRPDRAGAAIFQVWYRTLVADTVGDELGPELLREYLVYDWIHGPMMVDLMAHSDARWFDDVRTPRVERRDDVVRRSFAAAVEWLRRHQGGDPRRWRWGDLHTVTFVHRPLGEAGLPLLSALFNGGTVPAPGDRFSVNAAWFSGNLDRPYESNGGAAHRFLVDLADFDRALGVLNTGQSEHLFHRHREDMVPLWQQVAYHPLPFSRERVRAAAEGTLVLRPH
jgi:penicillin G amidase